MRARWAIRLARTPQSRSRSRSATYHAASTASGEYPLGRSPATDFFDPDGVPLAYGGDRGGEMAGRGRDEGTRPQGSKKRDDATQRNATQYYSNTHLVDPRFDLGRLCLSLGLLLRLQLGLLLLVRLLGLVQFLLLLLLRRRLGRRLGRLGLLDGETEWRA